MHIIVTTPKKEIETSNLELIEVQKNGGYFFRVFHFKPKIGIGERLYEIENDKIVGFGTVIGLEQITDSVDCSTTLRQWGKSGDWIVKYNNWQYLKSPVDMKGIQAIRYTEELFN